MPSATMAVAPITTGIRHVTHAASGSTTIGATRLPPIRLPDRTVPAASPRRLGATAPYAEDITAGVADPAPQQAAP